MYWISIILALSVPIVLIGSLWIRKGGTGEKTKGIGWQFIRFNVLSISMPIVGILALNNVLTSEASTIIAAAMAYSFGKSDEKNNQTKEEK